MMKRDIGELDKNALRSQLGMVLQDAHVFSGTIRENIRFGSLDATDQEVEEAARLVMQMPLSIDCRMDMRLFSMRKAVI